MKYPSIRRMNNDRLFIEGGHLFSLSCWDGGQCLLAGGLKVTNTKIVGAAVSLSLSLFLSL